jgi:hypothetical protein
MPSFADRQNFLHQKAKKYLRLLVLISPNTKSRFCVKILSTNQKCPYKKAAHITFVRKSRLLNVGKIGNPS